MRRWVLTLLCASGALWLWMGAGTIVYAATAQEHFVASRFDEALATAEALLQDPKMASDTRDELMLIAGAARVYLHRLDAARETLDQLLTAARSPAVRAGAQFYLAEAAYAAGAYKDALMDYQAVVAYQEAMLYRPLAQEGIGWSYYHLGQCEESVAAFEPLRQTESLTGATLYAVGDCARRLQRPEQAVRIFEQLATQQPDDAWADEALVAWGDTLLQQGLLTEAQAVFEQALSVYPESPLVPGMRLYLGQVALGLARPQEAQAQFTDVVERHPHSPYVISAYMGLGQATVAMEQWSAATTAFQEVVARAPRGPHAPTALVQLGYIALQQQDWHAARTAYTQVVGDFPDSAWTDEATYRVGTVWQAQGEPLRAIEQFTRVVQRTTDAAWRAPAHVGWADALMVLGRWAEARALYHVIQERYAASAWSQIAAVREAISQRALGDQEAAVARLEQLLEEALAPAMAAEAQIELARAAIEQEAWDRAVARLEAARTLDAAARTQADVLFWSGWIAMRQAQWSQALGAWNELHTQYPGSARDEACWPWRLVAVTHVKGVAVALDVLATWHEERAAAQVLRMAQTVASTLADDGLASEAIQVYIFLADHAPVEARAAWYFHLGELYQEQRQVEDAIAMYQRAMREEARGPLASRSALAAARLLENSQRSDQAVALYRHVASMPGQASRVALERLEQLRHAADDR